VRDKDAKEAASCPRIVISQCIASRKVGDRAHLVMRARRCLEIVRKYPSPGESRTTA
jgi:hypothetical protein